MLYLSGIVLSFFLSFVLMTKRNKSQADYVLLAWLVTIGLHLLTFYLLYTNQDAEYPTIIALGFPLPLAHGPFLYLYTCLQTSSDPFHKKQLLHFLPLLLSYLLFGEFFLLPIEQKIEVFRLKGQGFEIQRLINLYAIYVSGIVYVTLSIDKLLKYRKNLVHLFSNTDKINFNWLLYLIIWMVVIWIVVLFVQEDELIFGATALFVLWIGYFSIKQVQVFSQNTSPPSVNSSSTDNPYQESNNEIASITGTDPALDENFSSSKYQKSTLSEQEASLIHERLKLLMAEQKPFTNPDLTLNELARSLQVHPNTLSQVINSKENRNFYDLINARRVEEFIKHIAQSASQQYTLLAVAYDCGFNSKASFNRNFKKYIGVTPRDYLKQQRK